MQNSKPIGAPIEKVHILSLNDYPKIYEEKNRMNKVPLMQLVVLCMLFCALDQILVLCWMVSDLKAT